MVEVAAFVGGDRVKGGGKAEAEASDKRIGKADRCHVEVLVGAEELVGGGVGGEEGDRDFGEGWGGARPNHLWRFTLHFRWRLEGADEPGAEEAGKGGAAAQFIFATRSVGSGLHGADVESIRECEMVEAFGDAPRGGMRAPGGLVFGQASDQGLCVFFRGGVCVV